YLGWLMHGVPGGLIAGGLFLAPSLLVLIGLSSVYAFWGQLPLLTALFTGLKPAVLAIVILAAWRLGRRILQTPLLVALAVAAFAALSVLQIPYPFVVIGAALVGLLSGRLRPSLLVPKLRPASAAAKAEAEAPAAATATAIHDDHTPTPAHARFSRPHLAATLLIWALALVLPLIALTALGGWNGPLALMARFFTRVALLSFGGAYAVLPYVAQGAVEQFEWLSASQMLDGLALGETTPGPLIMVVAFVGFMGGWHSTLLDGPGSWPAALATTLVTVWFTFLPSFGFILVGAPLVEASRGNLRLGAPLSAITAAVVGVIASLAVFFAGPVLWSAAGFNPVAALLVLLALLAQIKLGWGVLKLIAAGAGAGVLISMLAKAAAA
ncbi:MAG: chromate transporter, partial [Prochlorococcaceae cyanobacterium]